jgi:hypothetical protein
MSLKAGLSRLADGDLTRRIESPATTRFPKATKRCAKATTR